MRKLIISTLLMFLMLIQVSSASDDGDLLNEFDTDGDYVEVSDPLEPLNRVFFQFNDTLYNYVLSPVAESYAAVLPQDIRASIGNAFENILAPIRIVNSLLQGKITQSGTEVLRFVINTTAGAGGLGDPAKEVFNLHSAHEDLGQTLGKYGVGDGVYICWPIFGPSNIRDTVGRVGDSFLNPLSYLYFDDNSTGFLIHAGKRVNKTSLFLGEYEEFVQSSFDPYIAVRDFYTESRQSKIKDKHMDSETFPKQTNLLGIDSEYLATLESVPAGKNIGIIDQQNKSKIFFIQVGVFTDKENVNQLAQRLLTIDQEPIIVEYQRDDYNFYGIQVHAGNKFELAKNSEQALNKSGFGETIVLTR